MPLIDTAKKLVSRQLELSLFFKSHFDEIDDIPLALIVTINIQVNSLCR